MFFLKRRQRVEPESFGLALAARLRDASDTKQLPGPLPGNPWARRLVVALAAHVHRQRWVAKVLRDDLHVDPRAIAAGGAFEHPVPAAGQVPGLPEWSFRFHGIGCCLTHVDGTVIDVDFDEHGAEGVDPFFYNQYLASLTRPDAIEAMLRRPAPLHEWWMAELDSLRELGWIEGDHRVRVTRLGDRWASALAPAFEVLSGMQDRAEALRAALLIEDFPWAAQMPAAAPSTDVRRRAEECAARRASQLERELSANRSRRAFSALAVLDEERAARHAREIIGGDPLDGLTCLSLDYLLGRAGGPGTDVLVALAKRAKGSAPPEPRLRTVAVLAVLKEHRADSLPELVRAQLLDALAPEAHSGEGVAAVLHWLLDPEPGLGRLSRCLGSPVPIARAEAAAALALLGTPEAAAALREGGDAAEAKAALALLRGVPPEPGPAPVGEVIEWRGTPTRVYAMDELLAAECPWLVKSSLANLSKDLGPLLARWWAQ